MPEKGLAVKRAEEPTSFRPLQLENLFDKMGDIFPSIARRAYELFESNGRIFGHDLDNWLRAEAEILEPVHVEISESDEALKVHAQVPGFTEKELEVKVTPRHLTIAGKRETTKEEKTEKKVYSEFRSNQVFRMVHLPAEVDRDKVKAELKNGVLEIELIKTAPAKVVKIETKAA